MDIHPFFSFLSIVPLFLLGGWAWLARVSDGSPEQRKIEVAAWFSMAFVVFLFLRSAGWSIIKALAPIVVASAAGYFEPELKNLLFWAFTPKAQKAPPK